MKAPLFIRPLTQDEHRQIQVGLRSSDAFVLRRCQILLASARGERAPAIAKHLGCDDQTVRNAIQGFNTVGLAVLKAASSRPHRLPTTFPPRSSQAVESALAPQSWRLWPRPWSVDLATSGQDQFRAGYYCPPNVGGKCAPSTPKLSTAFH